ncbi:MAG: HAMP domain-containing histidine kinase [Alphaproteobacteria bacterium]|nr:HAMP domain-containing histidine kinase [Alphaproteobacteria bacterium]MBV8406077.1 HAMP domain-containing histidine kinase [Alphaproteobacteria bacterium]
MRFAAASVQVRAWCFVAAVGACNVVLIAEILDRDRSAAALSMWMGAQPTVSGAGGRNSPDVFWASLPTSSIPVTPKYGLGTADWLVLLGVFPVLASVLLAASLQRRLRVHSALTEEINRRREPFPTGSRNAPLWELQGQIAQGNQMIVERNNIGLQINRAAGDNAHALKSPLAVAKIAIRRIRSQTPSSTLTINAALDAAEESIERMSDVIEAAQILDEETAALIAAPRCRLSVTAAVVDVLHQQHPLLAAKRLEVTHELRGEVPVYAGEGMLEMLVWDLLRNAVAAAPDESILSIFVERDDHWAVLRVEDEGPWIAADALEFTFEREYVRNGESRTRTPENAVRRRYFIAKRNTDLLGGYLTIVNRVAGGLSVVVRLPLG